LNIWVVKLRQVHLGAAEGLLPLEGFKRLLFSFSNLYGACSHEHIADGGGGVDLRVRLVHP